MIPKLIHQIWIGPKTPPVEWLMTWPEKNPDFRCTLWNDEAIEKFGLKNKKLYDEFVSKKEYHAAADVARIEIVERFGGVYLDADSECLHRLDGEFMKGSFFAVYDHEVKGHPGRINNGVIGAEAGHPILKMYIEKMGQAEEVRPAWSTIGGKLFTECIERFLIKQNANDKSINILPCWTFWPENHDGRRVEPKGTVYARQYWGTSKNLYQQKNMDLLYILGNASDWQNNEIRYSIRSAEKNFDFENIAIVGYYPAFCQDILHINYQDTTNDKTKNGMEKLRAACMNKYLSEKFVLMNDDFFFIKKTKQIEPWHNGTLEEYVKMHPTKSGSYFNAAKATVKMLAEAGLPCLNYDVHMPMIMEKKKVIEMFERFKYPKNVYFYRTVYGNMFNIGSVQKSDVKIYSEDFIDVHKHEKIISISNKLALNKQFQKMIKELFPKASAYEIESVRDSFGYKGVRRFKVAQQFSYGGKEYRSGDVFEGSISDKLARINKLIPIVD